MFLIEQFTSHSHPHSSISLTSSRPLDVHFDVEFGELEYQDDLELAGPIRTSGASSPDANAENQTKGPERAYPLTLGLIMHGLADGLALGVSALSNTEADLSLVVFLALIIHKGE